MTATADEVNTASPLYVYQQELPNDAVALERAEASLRLWEEGMSCVLDPTVPGDSLVDQELYTTMDTSVEQPARAISCSCSHIQKVLPVVLSLEFCMNPKSNSMWLKNPVHAMHFTSQGLTELSKSATATNMPKQTHQLATQPVLYGDEQERSLAMRLPGLPDIWHPAIQSDYCLAKPPTPSKGKKSSNPKKPIPDKPESKSNQGSEESVNVLKPKPGIKKSPIVSPKPSESGRIKSPMQNGKSNPERPTKQTGSPLEKEGGASIGKIDPSKKGAAREILENDPTSQSEQRASSQKATSGKADEQVKLSAAKVGPSISGDSLGQNRLGDKKRAVIPKEAVKMDIDEPKLSSSSAENPAKKSELKQSTKELTNMGGVKKMEVETVNGIQSDVRAAHVSSGEPVQHERTTPLDQKLDGLLVPIKAENVDIDKESANGQPMASATPQSKPNYRMEVAVSGIEPEVQTARVLSREHAQHESTTPLDQKPDRVSVPIKVESMDIGKEATNGQPMASETPQSKPNTSSNGDAIQDMEITSEADDKAPRPEEEPSTHADKEQTPAKLEGSSGETIEPLKPSAKVGERNNANEGMTAGAGTKRASAHSSIAMNDSERSVKRSSQPVESETSAKTEAKMNTQTTDPKPFPVSGSQTSRKAKEDATDKTTTKNAQEGVTNDKEDTAIKPTTNKDQEGAAKAQESATIKSSNKTQQVATKAIGAATIKSTIKVREDATSKPKELDSASKGKGGTTGSSVKKSNLFHDADFRLYHSREENSRQVRRAMFRKRQAAVSPIPPTPKNGQPSNEPGAKNAAKSSEPDKKKRKLDKVTRLMHLSNYQPPAVPKCVPPNISSHQKREQEKAERQALRWMTHYRMSSREVETLKSRSSSRRPDSFCRNFVFGAIDKEDTRDSCTHTGMDTELGDGEFGLLYCLDCGSVGCRSDIRKHMVLTGHTLAVTFRSVNENLRRELYCYHCDTFFQHPLFLQEDERLLLAKIFPYMTWQVDEKSYAIQRSFDPLNFMRVPGFGIFWNGFRATYPAPVPRHHTLAACICRLRYQIVHGNREMMLQEFQKKHGTQSNSTTRNRKILNQLLSELKFPIAQPVGMYNLGNTCFQSSVFQCLVHCKPLQQHFLQKIGHASGACRLYRRERQSSNGLHGLCLACEMDCLFLHYQSRSCGINITKAMHDLADNASSEFAAMGSLTSNPVTVLYAKNAADGCIVEPASRGEPLVAQKDLLAATWKCKEMSHLAGYAEHDAHEFLHAFLEALGKHSQKFQRLVWETLGGDKPEKVEPKIPNVIQDLFEGSLRSVLLCQECGAKRVQKESFLSISLDLSKEVQKTTAAHFVPPRSSSSSGVPVSSPTSRETRKLSVEKCLRHFTSPEQLLDPVQCPQCQKKTTTKKQHVVSRLPPVLCLHLKRFHGLQKMDDFVSFPAHNLNMGEYLPHWCEDSGFSDNASQRLEDFAPPPDAFMNYLAQSIILAIYTMATMSQMLKEEIRGFTATTPM
eukprot:CAMPEP_0168752468 /NCGR_PEP_ID=MMETSP0724-20121128/18402_1 /TAXON_ID=265536 /ORGANISM="Amphiprora sp., Strain CCMP467" /LENGTH=1494 /DNA_ID=CAMNT_0008800719 /DNA_START=25 /DNA_END=4510 /DNA_ORIENTATION=+